jgi:hypothetical protein
MNKWTLLLILVGLGAVGMLNRDKISAYLGQKSESADATPAPATPHPAQDSVAKARKTYPALAVPNSPFNKKFVELYNAKKASEPEFLVAADWPMKLADETANALTVSGTTFQPPTQGSSSSLNNRPANFAGPTAAPSVQLPGLKGSALDQRPPDKHYR